MLLHVEQWIHFHSVCSSLTVLPFFTHSTGDGHFSRLQFQTITICSAMIKHTSFGEYMRTYFYVFIFRTIVP